jgi:acyl-CoA reductase-like NAD-dependent aldehyde dehydrogenase
VDGGPAQDDAAITPVISKSSADFIEGLVKDAEAKGAKLLQPYRREGNLIWPLLIDHVTPVRSPFSLVAAVVNAAITVTQQVGSGLAGGGIGVAQV